MSKALHISDRPQVSSPLFVLAFDGWNDAGESATFALQHLAELAKAEECAFLDCEDYYDFTVRRPNVRIGSGNTRSIEWPGMRFQYGKLPSGVELVFGLGPEPHTRWRGFCDEVVEFANEFGVQRVLLLGAFLADLVYSRPVGVTGFAANSPVLTNFDLEISSYEGPTGIVGVLSERFRAEGLDVVSLWAGLPHYIDVMPNPRGSLALLEKVVECYELEQTFEGLKAEVVSFEEKISEMVNGDPELAAYVRELKRREFAQ